MVEAVTKATVVDVVGAVADPEAASLFVMSSARIASNQSASPSVAAAEGVVNVVAAAGLPVTCCAPGSARVYSAV